MTPERNVPVGLFRAELARELHLLAAELRLPKQTVCWQKFTSPQKMFVYQLS